MKTFWVKLGLRLFLGWLRKQNFLDSDNAPDNDLLSWIIAVKNVGDIKTALKAKAVEKALVNIVTDVEDVSVSKLFSAEFED